MITLIIIIKMITFIKVINMIALIINFNKVMAYKQVQVHI